jgi:hypothetical protein
MSTNIQDRTAAAAVNVILKAVGNGKKNYEHDGDNVSVLVSKEDYTFLKKTRGTMDVDELVKGSDILNNAIKRLGIDNEVYCAEAMVWQSKGH